MSHPLQNHRLHAIRRLAADRSEGERQVIDCSDGDLSRALPILVAADEAAEERRREREAEREWREAEWQRQQEKANQQIEDDDDEEEPEF